MKMKLLTSILISTILFMTGCTVQNNTNSGIPQEEQEIRAVPFFQKVLLSIAMFSGISLRIATGL